MPLNHFCSKLRRRIHSLVNLTAQFLLRPLQRINHLSKCHVPNNQEIHITAAPMFSAGERSVNESKRDAPLQRKQGCPEDIDEPSGL